MLKHRGVRRQTHETDRYDPGNADTLGTFDQSFPPAPSCWVLGCRFVVGVEQQVDVGNDRSRCSSVNLRCFSRKASTSDWSLNWLSFTGSIPGRKPLRSGRTRYTGRSSGTSGARERRRVSLTTCLNGTSSRLTCCLRSSSRVRVVRMEPSKHHWQVMPRSSVGRGTRRRANRVVAGLSLFPLVVGGPDVGGAEAGALEA